MPDPKKFDAFKPPPPAIPGVSNAPARPSAPEPSAPAAASAAEKSDRSSEGLPIWITLSIAGALILIIAGVWWNRRPASQQAAATEAVDLPAAAADPPKPVEHLPIAPGEVATTDELAKPWSAKKFIFHTQLTDERSPAMVVRLPGNAYWGFSLREPFGTCELEWITDLDKLRNEYHYRADHPMVGDPCNHSVFDLGTYVSVSSGLVRGQVVQGAAVRPPMAIEIEIKGKQVLAVRSE
jgi:hypothetical protein